MRTWRCASCGAVMTAGSALLNRAARHYLLINSSYGHPLCDVCWQRDVAPGLRRIGLADVLSGIILLAALFGFMLFVAWLVHGWHW